jgi:SAM-dependent methyltransferase
VTVTERFRAAVEEHLRPYAGNFNHEVMLQGHLDVSRFVPWVQQVAEYHPVRDSVVLSSGCGSAGDLLAFMQAGASRAYGIETDDAIVRLARSRFEATPFASTVQLDCYAGDVVPYSSDLFDIVFSMHVIEHTRNPAGYLTELFRVLKPGGIVFLDVPNRYYRLEQHTLLPYIHYLPPRPRDRLIGFLLAPPLGPRLSGQTTYKLQTLVGFMLPSAAQILKIVETNRANYALRVEDAYFHSYSPKHQAYAGYPGMYLFGSSRQMTTFRIVVSKL